MGSSGRSLLCAFSCLIALATNADIIHVKADATGSGDGSSWTNAFTSLQPAIDAASVSDQVWIAQGTYLPTSWPNGGTTEREKHFSLKNGVSVYGGFAGIETALTQRDPTTCPSTLSGDLEGDDADGDGDGRSDPSTTGNNAYHVFYHPRPLGLTNSALIDGVTIRGGTANFFPHNRGGGIYNESSSPTIANCTIVDNFAADGGGIGNSFHSSPAVANCMFTDNSATNGGAICNRDYCSPAIANCTIAGNWARRGGGILNDYHSSPTIANCTIDDNASIEGAGIYSVGRSSPAIANCTIVGNRALAGGGGIYNYYFTSPTIANCIVWTNSPVTQIFDSSSTPNVYSCVVQGGYPGSNILSADPLLLPLGNHGGPTPTMPVSLGSPAIDAGAASGAPATDQRGFSRDALPDIGACEFQALALVSDVSNPAAIGSQLALRAISDIAGATFQWFGRQSGDAWDPVDGGTDGLFTTPPLELGLDLFVRVTGGGTNVDSAVQQIDVRGTYPEWVAFHGLAGADADIGASSAGDGIPNLIKYASGLDPHAPALPADHSTFFSNGASNTLCLTWVQSKTPTDLAWGFRQSRDLRAWSPADAASTLSESNTAYNVWSLVMPVESNSLFLDVEVTRAAP